MRYDEMIRLERLIIKADKPDASFSRADYSFTVELPKSYTKLDTALEQLLFAQARKTLVDRGFQPTFQEASGNITRVHFKNAAGCDPAEFAKLLEDAAFQVSQDQHVIAVREDRYKSASTAPELKTPLAPTEKPAEISYEQGVKVGKLRVGISRDTGSQQKAGYHLFINYDANGMDAKIASHAEAIALINVIRPLLVKRNYTQAKFDDRLVNTQMEVKFISPPKDETDFVRAVNTAIQNYAKERSLAITATTTNVTDSKKSHAEQQRPPKAVREYELRHSFSSIAYTDRTGKAALTSMNYDKSNGALTVMKRHADIESDMRIDRVLSEQGIDLLPIVQPKDGQAGEFRVQYQRIDVNPDALAHVVGKLEEVGLLHQGTSVELAGMLTQRKAVRLV